MRLTVFSHKPCWSAPDAPSGYATDGGFSFQMRALSELFEATTLVVPCYGETGKREGEIALAGHNLSIVPLTMPTGSNLQRKLSLPVWFVRNMPTLLRESLRADAIHVPIPGDIGTFGMVLAYLLRKPLFVRHCGNWFVQKTLAERFWKWFMEQFAGGRNIMLATGGSQSAPSQRSAEVRWIFSTSLTERELQASSVREAPAGGRARLVISCRQDRAKGAGVVIDSLPLLLGEFPHARLDVVGDGPALPEFKRQADALGLCERIKFHGKVDHERVLELLQQADLFCYPTTASDGFPKAVHEALACGLPAVTTHVSVLPQLLSNGCGVLIDEATPAAVAAGVRECLRDARRYRAMSAAAIMTARQYSLERWRDTIGDLLRRSWGPLRSDA
jgi:Glycosyl transferases group 1